MEEKIKNMDESQEKWTSVQEWSFDDKKYEEWIMTLWKTIHKEKDKQTLEAEALKEKLNQDKETAPIVVWEKFSPEHRLALNNLEEYIENNKDKLTSFVDDLHITSWKDLANHILKVNDDPYYNKLIMYIMKRIDLQNITFNTNNITNVSEDRKSINYNLLEVKALSELAGMNFSTYLLFTFIHESNHILFNYLWEGTQKIARDKFNNFTFYHQNTSKFEDMVRAYYIEKETNNTYQFNYEEFLTEAISNKYFIEYLRKIPSFSEKSKREEKGKLQTFVEYIKKQLSAPEREKSTWYDRISESFFDALDIPKWEKSLFTDIFELYLSTINSKKQLSSSKGKKQIENIKKAE